MRVLIVENDRQMADQLHNGLEREGYSPFVANDGEHCIEFVRSVALRRCAEMFC